GGLAGGESRGDGAGRGAAVPRPAAGHAGRAPRRRARHRPDRPAVRPGPRAVQHRLRRGRRRGRPRLRLAAAAVRPAVAGGAAARRGQPRALPAAQLPAAQPLKTEKGDPGHSGIALAPASDRVDQMGRLPYLLSGFFGGSATTLDSISCTLPPRARNSSIALASASRSFCLASMEGSSSGSASFLVFLATGAA